ncbi:RNA-directed DNA polymerase, eukaryota [Tanacetum coccineum]|uniref:RNA-directed DNA polymerase, eukaryota n=1 Tax=Tanacetum coccineum TaxID=301880 RepID=A0ABQ4X0C7_9ASTR
MAWLTPALLISGDDDTISFVHYCPLMDRVGCHPAVCWRGITISCLQLRQRWCDIDDKHIPSVQPMLVTKRIWASSAYVKMNCILAGLHDRGRACSHDVEEALLLSFTLALLIPGTGIAKISRKRSKQDKHGHGNGRAHKEPGECYQKSTVVNSNTHKLIPGRSPWQDVILAIHSLQSKGEVALKVLYKRLYALEMCKSISVAEKMGHPSLSHSFRRMPRGGVEQENFGLLCSKVANLVLPNISDRWSEVPTRWLRVVPIKVNVHDWRVCLDKLPTRADLSLRGMDISLIACPLCNSAVESTSHIFFTCPLARQVWRNFLIWWELEDVAFNSYNEWLIWIVNIHLHKQLKVFLEGETPLFTRYNRLYHLDQDKDCLIIDRINNGQWSWNWSRTNLGVRNLAYLCDMLNDIGQLNIDVNEDTCTWSLGPNGTFTVKDARYRIDQNILPTLAHATTWDKSIPRKVNVFMWRLSLDRLPHRLNLSSRGMDIPAISCPSCNANVESANHVFFECDIATDMWKLVFRWCDIPLFQASSWDSFNDWIISWHASKEKKHRFYVITTSVLWWLWRYRNSVTFNSQPLRKSDLFDNVRFSSFSWLHNRDHMKLSWNDWLMYPLSITRNGNG